MTGFLKIFASVLVLASVASAQYTNVLDNATTQVVDEVWTTTDVVVGSSTASNGLDIVGTQVINAATTVGRDAGADFNIVNVKDEASWVMSGDLTVGSAGSGNHMLITGGSVVSNVNAFVGGVGATGNVVEVSAADSLWANAGTLSIGGVSNMVSVIDGAEISATDLNISGTGNHFDLNKDGSFAIDNDLNVAQDGFNWNAGGLLSLTGELTGLAVSNNATYLNDGRSLTLDGGSLNTGSNDFAVGMGSAGHLVVTNGGQVIVGGINTNLAAGGILVASTNTAKMWVDNDSTVEASTLYIGTASGGIGSVAVTNGGLFTVDDLVITDSGSSLNIDDGGTLHMTSNFNAEAQTQVNLNAGGELIVGGVLTKSNALSGTERTLTLEGGAWASLDVVVSGTSNHLNMVEGGKLFGSNSTFRGYGNQVLVDGEGSYLMNLEQLTISGLSNAVSVKNGSWISTDTLSIEDGNALNLLDGGILDIRAVQEFNLAANSNLNWASGGNLSLAGNLTGMDSVSNVAGQASILSAGRDLTLLGSNAQWNVAENLIVGNGYSGSDLVVSNGATLSNADAFVGWGAGAGNNTVLVNGVGSTWKNSGGDFYVGAYLDGTNLVNTLIPNTLAGDGNAVTVENGAQVFVGEQVMTNAGMLVASTNGAQLVVGSGTVTVEETLYLGNESGTGTSIIRAGGLVSVGDLVFGTNSSLDVQSGGTFHIATNFNVAARAAEGFNWGDNGMLSVGGSLDGMTNVLHGGRDLTLTGSNAVWNVGDDLIVGADANKSILNVLNGASLFSDSTVLGQSTNSTDNRVVLKGGSSWTLTGDLNVGSASSGSNYVHISGGSTNTVSGDVYVGGDTASGNYVKVEGSNSWMDVAGSMAIGTTNSGVGNVLRVYDNASVDVGGDLTVRAANGVILNADGLVSVGGDLNVYSNAVLSGNGFIDMDGASVLNLIGEGIVIGDGVVFQGSGSNRVSMLDGTYTLAGSNSLQYVGFESLDMKGSTLAGFGTLDAFDSVNMTDSTISPSGANSSDVGTLTIEGDFNGSDILYRAQVYGDNYDQLFFTGSTQISLSNMSANVWVPNVPSNMTVTILQADAGLVGEFSSVEVTDELLLFDARLTNINDRIDVVVEANNERFSSALSLASTEAARAGFGGMKNSVFTRTKQLRRNLVGTAHDVPKTIPGSAPMGANGPGDDNTIFDMHVWGQYFSGKGTYAEHGDSYGFSQNNSGTTFGLDRLFGENLTAGLNYTYARSSARTTNLDQLDTETYWMGGYAEWVNDSGLYVDVLGAYGGSNYDSVREEGDYRGTGAYRGDAFGASVDVGQYYYYKNLMLSPYAGFHALLTSVDGYAEKSSFDELTYVDELSRNWAEASFGVKARYRMDTGLGRFQATGFAEWTHDFVQDDVQAVLSANNLLPVGMDNISPDPDSTSVGLGLGWISTDYLEVGIGYNGRFSEHYEEHTGSLMFDIMF